MSDAVNRSTQDAVRQAFQGKTIQRVDVTAVNQWQFTFTDGSNETICVADNAYRGPDVTERPVANTVISDDEQQRLGVKMQTVEELLTELIGEATDTDRVVVSVYQLRSLRDNFELLTELQRMVDAIVAQYVNILMTISEDNSYDNYMKLANASYKLLDDVHAYIQKWQVIPDTEAAPRKRKNVVSLPTKLPCDAEQQ